MLGPVGLFILWAVFAIVWAGISLAAALLVKLCSSEVQMTTQRIPAAKGRPARTVHGFYRWWGNLTGIGVGVLTLLFGLIVAHRILSAVAARMLVVSSWVENHDMMLLFLGLAAGGAAAGLWHARKLDRRKYARPSAAAVEQATARKLREAGAPVEALPVPPPPAVPPVGWSLPPNTPHWASQGK